MSNAVLYVKVFQEMEVIKLLTVWNVTSGVTVISHLPPLARTILQGYKLKLKILSKNYIFKQISQHCDNAAMLFQISYNCRSSEHTVAVVCVVSNITVK